MSRRARTWVAAAALLALVAGGTLSYGRVSGTFALFSGETKNPNAVVQGSWIPPLSLPVSSLNGSPYASEHVAWTVGAVPPPSNPITGYQVKYKDGGAATGTANCTGTYTNFSSLPASPASADLTGTNINDWWCFQLYGTSGTIWTSNTIQFTQQRIFVTAGYDQHNVTTASTARTGDQIVMTYNQNRGPIGAGNGTVVVRFCRSQGTILISTGNINNCTATPNIGRVSGQTIGSNMTCSGSGTAGNGTTTLTITLACGATTSAIGAGNAQFTPTGTGIASQGGTNVCSSTASPDCRPPTTANRF